MTCLVTGGAGLIGSALCKRLLSEGNHVIAIDKLVWGNIGSLNEIINDDNFSFVKADVLDKPLLEDVFENNRIDIIYHLASNTSIPQGQSNVKIDINDTLLTTISVLEMAVKYNVKQFVFTSSSTVYGNGEYIFDEQTVMRPISFYGAAKLSSEAFISAYSSRYDIQTWIVRLCNVIGPNTTHGIIYDIKNKLKGQDEVLHLLGDGLQEKPFIYIDDAIDGIQHIVNHATEQQNAYLVGNRDTVTVKRIAEIALEELNCSANIVFDNTPSWSGDVKKYYFNIRRVSELGWSPKYNSEIAVRKSFK